MEKTASAEKEKDKAKEEAQVARLTVVIVGEAKVKEEGGLARVQEAQVTAKEARAVAKKARHKAEAEAAHLEVEWTSLLLKTGVAKDEVSSLHSQDDKDKMVVGEVTRSP